MNSTRSPLFAGLLAIALVAVTVPLVPSSTADGTNQDTCEANPGPGDPLTLVDTWEGYIALSHPATPQVRATEALFFFVFENSIVSDPDPLGFRLKNWGNGQDAYVVHFGCNTDNNSELCLERDSPDNTDQGVHVLSGPLAGQPAYKVQFYSANPTGGLEGPRTLDPPSEGNGNACTSDIPSDAHYAVLYLEDGGVQGLQVEDHIVGPYTQDFKLELHNTS